MAILLTAGQAGDNPQLLPLLDQVRVARLGPGRPRQRPERVVADKAYSHPSTRAALRARGIAFTSPERSDQIAHRKAKGAAGGRPCVLDRAFTPAATSSSAASTGSSSSATSPPDTPNAPPTTAPNSSSPPSSYGSGKIRGTGPSTTAALV